MSIIFHNATKSPKHQRTPNDEYHAKNIYMIWCFGDLVVRIKQFGMYTSL